MTSSEPSHLFPVFSRCALAFERGAGSYLFTKDGKAYLDFGSGIAVNALGHGHPRLVNALQKQAYKLWHTSNLYYSPEQERLAKRLCEISFADRVFFCNSGTEAIEVAIKSARRYHYCKGAPRRNRIITIEGGFHGRTMGALAATGRKKYLEGFAPVPDGFDQVPFGDLRAVELAVNESTAAILVEPIQGESGVRPLPSGYLSELRDLCNAHGILLLLDEVQTGIGRTGKFFAYEHEGITPDVVATAKGLGGGFPVGACLATEAVAASMQPSTHGSTFGGNPLAVAVAEEVVEIVSSGPFLSRVEEASRRLMDGAGKLVSKYPSVFHGVRGLGLLVGLQCVPSVAEVLARIHEQGLLCIPASDNVLRLVPPLTITDSEIDEGISKLSAVAEALANAVRN
jgi:acetylornithine/N-succinyldiaminopimelate aminotransferase